LPVKLELSSTTIWYKQAEKLFASKASIS